MPGEVVAAGLELPEGPVLLDDGRVAFVQQALGRVSAYSNGKVETISDAPGAPNAVTFGNDGSLYAAQNGGVVGDWQAAQPTEPAIERISLGGDVQPIRTAVAGHTLRAPNDVAFGPDGRLWFTDPGEAYDPAQPKVKSRLFSIGGDHDELVAELAPAYANGLGFTVDGRLLWVESYPRTVNVLVDGKPRVVAQLPDDHIPDGLDVAVDGRIFISSVTSHGITVVDPDEGVVVDFIRLDDDALPTNCCFVGGDLWVTDFGVDWKAGDGNGRLWRVPTDAIGRPQHRGAV